MQFPEGTSACFNYKFDHGFDTVLSHILQETFRATLKELPGHRKVDEAEIERELCA
jgi:hypothetical protein